MSNQSTKVSGKSQNTSGEVSLSLSEVSDVSLSALSNSDLLKYTGSTWENKTPSDSATSLQYIRVGQGESNDYNNSGSDSQLGTGDTLYFYDSSPINTIDGATINKYLTTDWVESVTLPVGEYQVLCKWSCAYTSSTGTITFRAEVVGGSALTSMGISLNGTRTNGYLPSIVSSGMRLTSQQSIEFSIVTTNFGAELKANQGNVPSENSYFIIQKVG